MSSAGFRPQKAVIRAILALLVVLAAAGVALGGRSSPDDRGPPAGPQPSNSSPSRDIASRSSTAIRGLRAWLEDEETNIGRRRISWTTSWHVCWQPVPEAAGYLVTGVSFEGAGNPREIDRPCYELTVATGVSEKPGDYPGRKEQLNLMQSSLSVSIAALSENGGIGPASPDIVAGTVFGKQP